MLWERLLALHGPGEFTNCDRAADITSILGCPLTGQGGAEMIDGELGGRKRGRDGADRMLEIDRITGRQQPMHFGMAVFERADGEAATIGLGECFLAGKLGVSGFHESFHAGLDRRPGLMAHQSRDHAVHLACRFVGQLPGERLELSCSPQRKLALAECFPHAGQAVFQGLQREEVIMVEQMFHFNDFSRGCGELFLIWREGPSPISSLLTNCRGLGLRCSHSNECSNLCSVLETRRRRCGRIRSPSPCGSVKPQSSSSGGAGCCW